MIQQQKCVGASTMQPLVGVWKLLQCTFYQWQRGLAKNILHRLVLDALLYKVKLYYTVLYITNILDEREYKKNKGIVVPSFNHSHIYSTYKVCRSPSHQCTNVPVFYGAGRMHLDGGNQFLQIHTSRPI
jgi:hypothetical protein